MIEEHVFKEKGEGTQEDGNCLEWVKRVQYLAL